MALAAELESRGAIRSDAWRRAFETVPRHVLVPRFYDWEGGTRPPDEPVVAANDPRRWLPKVYSDTVLAIEVDRKDGTITSSSSRPSMMAVFLEALDVRDRGSVLEIRTGSGHNAALLCERLASQLLATRDSAA